MSSSEEETETDVQLTGEASSRGGDKPEDALKAQEIIIRDKVLTFDEASKCLNTLSKDESCLRYCYIQFSASDQKLTDINTLLNFRHVLFVDVSGNYLQTQALQCLAGLPFLIQLKAQRNFVESCDLKPMCYLQELSLARNRIANTIGIIQPELCFLDLNYNQIYEVIIPSDEVPNLKELEMRGNFIFEIGGTYPRSLEKLYLAENNLTRFVASDMEQMPHLKILHLRNNSIRKLDGFSANLAELKYLNLRDNKITKLRQLRKLQCLPALEVLIILENPVSGDVKTKAIREEDADDDDEDEELGEDQEEVFDPNRVAILALLPNLIRINKVPVTFVEREQARLDRDKLLAEMMDAESSDEEVELPSTATDFKTDYEEEQIVGEDLEAPEDTEEPFGG